MDLLTLVEQPPTASEAMEADPIVELNRQVAELALGEAGLA
mgnify:FL=1